MAEALRALLVQELAIKICEALGLNPGRVANISFDLPASELFGPVVVRVELVSGAELLGIDWEEELKGARVEVTVVRDEKAAA